MRKLRLREVRKYAHGHQADNQWNWEHEPREGDRLFCSNYTRWPLFFLICELTQFYLSGSWQGSLACCSPRGCKESDTTERLNNKTTKVSRILPKLEGEKKHICLRDSNIKELEWMNVSALRAGSFCLFTVVFPMPYIDIHWIFVECMCDT